MYSLDVNFLNDRPEYKPDVTKRTGGGIPIAGRRPLWIGLGVGLALPLLALGSWLFLQSDNNNLQARSTELETRLNALRAQEGELKKLESEVKLAKDDATNLASVFNQIKPYSALMQEMRDRIPPGVQITAIQQVPAPIVAGAPQPSPSPGAAQTIPLTYVQITGKAKTFDDVNDFYLMLQRSPLLKGSEIKVLSAVKETGEKPLQPLSLPNVPQPTQTQDPVQLPRLVNFSMRTALTDTSPTDLVEVLNAKGAKGLVTRLQVLKQKGVTQTTTKGEQKK
jgi:type IV pilus assembly protein PilN